MNHPGQQAVVHYYDTHPINEEQILHTLRAKGLSLNGLTEEILKDYDQDHYGGVEAVDVLAARSGIAAQHHVLDVCSGMGGPARYLAHRYGCRVTGLDLTESRYRGAIALTRLVGLDGRVDFRIGNALDMPFENASFDGVIGQEAWAHVPEKDRLIGECARVVRSGGFIAFTDIVRRGALDAATTARLEREMAFSSLETLDGYSGLLRGSGATVQSCEDLSEHWARILVQRLEMYRSLEDETIARFGEAHYRAWDDTYSFFVGLFAAGKLGGGRFVARRA